MKIIFIFSCSGMFRDVPCSGFYRRPGPNGNWAMLSTTERNTFVHIFLCSPFLKVFITLAFHTKPSKTNGKIWLSFLPLVFYLSIIFFVNINFVSLRKQLTFDDATAGFSAKWHLRNERRNSIFSMTSGFPLFSTRIFQHNSRTEWRPH